MIISQVSKDNYQIKLPSKIINIYDHTEIQNITKRVIKKISKHNKLYGLAILEIYQDINYGTIIEIKNIKKIFTVGILDLSQIHKISFTPSIMYFMNCNGQLNIINMLSLHCLLMRLQIDLIKLNLRPFVNLSDTWKSMDQTPSLPCCQMVI